LAKSTAKALTTKGTKETQRNSKSKNYKRETSSQLQFISRLRKVKVASGMDGQGKRAEPRGI
jgi:hypothetical protein